MIKFNCTDAEFDNIIADKMLITDFYDDRSEKFREYHWDQEYKDETRVEIISPARQAIFIIDRTTLWENGDKKQIAVRFRG